MGVAPSVLLRGPCEESGPCGTDSNAKRRDEMEKGTSGRGQTEKRVVVIPLWEAATPRPLGKERRKDGGTLDRHVQRATGVAPAESVQRRQPPQPQLERVASLWRETADAHHGSLPVEIVNAA